MSPDDVEEVRKAMNAKFAAYPQGGIIKLGDLA